MRDAFVAELTSLASQDSAVTLITGDLGFGVLTNFSQTFPNQFVNAGVAEQNMTAIASGLALSGFRPYTYSIANFTTLRCLEQIRNDVCYHDANVTLVSVGGGFSYGQLGMSHFATEDLAILRALPNMRVVAPSEPWEVGELVRQLFAKPGPAYLRLDKGRGGTEQAAGQPIVLGKARCVREGSDLTIATIGGILSEAVAAAGLLAEQGLSARVLSFNSLKPFDTDAVLAAARETGGLIVVEEHVVSGGLAGLIAETCLEGGASPGFFGRIGLDDCYPSVVGDQQYLRREHGMDSHGIVAMALRHLGQKS